MANYSKKHNSMGVVMGGRFVIVRPNLNLICEKIIIRIASSYRQMQWDAECILRRCLPHAPFPIFDGCLSSCGSDYAPKILGLKRPMSKTFKM